MQFPVIESKRLLLSDFNASDETAVFRLFSDNSVIEHYDLSAFTSVEQARELIKFFQSRYEDKSGIRWAIRLKDTGQLIETCGFNSWSQKMKNAVIGYDLMPAYWGSGYAIEAVRSIVLAAFEGQLPCGSIHRIQADTVPGNHGSETLLNRLGFKEEGMRRDAGYWKGKFHDLNCFGLLRTVFKA
ncbi:GNAT family N-acetyltransferase [Microbulbifer pacificus]|uniref:GNAT family protein n=1 Tax=Microbulbifer pacificus TaxID=407164 RepID=A0AAU0MWL9_9GAMM|nr:GNAT family protein [Microbulbifer pacificus]WOX05060.1 GNAT family protein [Microbulbifer pacificus]